MAAFCVATPLHIGAVAAQSVVTTYHGVGEHRTERLKLTPTGKDARGRYHGTVKVTGLFEARQELNDLLLYVYNPKTKLLTLIDTSTGEIEYRVEGQGLIDTSTGEIVWADK